MYTHAKQHPQVKHNSYKQQKYYNRKNNLQGLLLANNKHRHTHPLQYIHGLIIIQTFAMLRIMFGQEYLNSTSKQ